MMGILSPDEGCIRFNQKTDIAYYAKKDWTFFSFNSTCQSFLPILDFSQRLNRLERFPEPSKVELDRQIQLKAAFLD